jgi:hypothetical protein
MTDARRGPALLSTDRNSACLEYVHSASKLSAITLCKSTFQSDFSGQCGGWPPVGRGRMQRTRFAQAWLSCHLSR